MTNFIEEASVSAADSENLVYVRRIAQEEAREIVPAEAFAMISEPDDLFGVHTSDGKRLAIVEGRDAAFAAARAHDLRPRSVH